jgi:hypothetical protein
LYEGAIQGGFVHRPICSSRAFGFRACFAALLASLCACAHLQPPEEGGAPWWKAESGHFVLYTDLGPEEADAQLSRLERAYGAMVMSAWAILPEPSARDGEKAPLVAFRGSKELHNFTAGDRGYRTSYTTGVIVRVNAFEAKDAVGEPLLVTQGETLLTESRAVRDLLADRALAAVPASLPAWLRTGALAMLHGAIDDNGFTTGFKRPVGWEQLLSHQEVPWRAALQQSTLCELLVYQLRVRRTAAYGQFVRALADGTDERSAWEASFPGLEGRALGELLEEARSKGSVFTQPLAPLQAQVRIAPLPPAEVHALWGLLDRSAGNGESADAELARALALEPSNGTALLLSISPSSRLQELRKLAALTHDDPRPSFLLARESDDLAEVAAHAGRLAAGGFRPLPMRRLELAALVSSKRNPEAAASARELLKLRGTTAQDVYNAAVAFANLGACEELRAAVAAARKRFPPRAAAGAEAKDPFATFDRQCR